MKLAVPLCLCQLARGGRTALQYTIRGRSWPPSPSRLLHGHLAEEGSDLIIPSLPSLPIELVHQRFGLGLELELCRVTRLVQGARGDRRG